MKNIFPNFDPNKTMNSDERGTPRRPNNGEIENEELTCCHRATWCNPYIRDILVTNPLSSKYCTQFTYSTVFWLVTITAIFLMTYGMIYFNVGDAMLPGGGIFGLFVLIITAYFLGWTLAYIPYLNLPPVFGMLLAGIIVRNTGMYNIHDALGVNVTSKIRTFAVTFVMLRAGLQLTSYALREHPFFVLNLAVVPCTMEMLMVTLCCHTILGYPWAWAFLTGSIIACISPVVPINCILALTEEGYGEDKEIGTLLFAAASIDDIHIVSVYSICYSFIFTHDKIPTHWWSYIPGGCRDMLMGIICGSLLGLFFVFFPHRNHKYVLWYRVVGLVLGSLMCTTAPSKLAITGGGFLATIIMSLIATTGWRILSYSHDVTPMREAVATMWHFMQPVLVGVIGADIDFHNWSLARFGLYVVCITLGLLIRMIFAFLATFHTPFNTKERLFIALSWISKGTLQAALAPMTFEQALRDEDPDEIELAIDVVRIAVVSIVFLAPLGAIVMMLTGPVLLSKTSEEEHRRRRELSYHEIMSLQPVRRRHS